MDSASHSPPDRRALWVAGALVLVALVLRLWTLGALRDSIEVHAPILDGRFYLELARRLAGGAGWPSEPIFMTPLYPWLMGGLFQFVPDEVSSIQLAQTVLGLFTLILLMAGLWRKFGATPALLAGILYTFYGPIIAMESLVLTESLMCFLVTVALLIWPESPEERRSPLRLLGFALVCGLLVLGRGTFLVIPVAAAGILLWRGRGQTTALRQRLIPLILLAVGVVLPLLPLAVFQTQQAGSLQVLTVNGGLNLYLGNNPWARGIYSSPPEIDLSRDIKAQYSASQAAGRRLDLVETSDYWRQQALAFLRDDPGRAAWLWGRKALLYLTPKEIPQIEYFDGLARQTEPLRLAFLRFFWVLPLAVVGAVWGIRRAGWKVAPYMIVVATGWLATIVFFATGRYRVAVLPGFLCLAALGLVFAIESIRTRRGAWACWAVLGLATLGQFALPTFDEAKARAYHAYQVGQRQLEANRLAEAQDSYGQALAADPDLGQAWHGKGAAFVRQGNLEAAADAYENAAQRLPRSVLTWYNLGSVYGRLGNDAGAREAFEHALAVDPGHLDSLFSLGVARAKLGDAEGAQACWHRVLQIAPGHQGARNALQAMQRDLQEDSTP